MGGRGNRYDYNGNFVDLPQRYASFIKAIKVAHPNKRLVMNAVSGFGAQEIAETDKVDFLYNEMWDSEETFEALRNTITDNDQFSNCSLRTVFAAYMNYDIAEYTGTFNTPGVLLTDAVMFALGGAHLELGDHMLCKEYFPNSNLEMDETLETSIVRYYDFLTAYQNLLRGNDTEAEINFVPQVTNASKDVSINAWPPRQNAVTAYAKSVEGETDIHLINFRDANRLNWRDVDGTMPEPRQILQLPLKLNVSSTVNKVWVASPDRHAGASEELAFEQTDGILTLTQYPC